MLPRRGSEHEGVTLIEAVIAALVVSLVVGLTLTVFRGGWRVNEVAGATVAAQAAVIVREELMRDLQQMGYRPGREGPVRIGSRSAAFYRAYLDGPRIRLRPVRYILEPTAHGNSTLVREEWSGPGRPRRHVVPGVVIRSLVFSEIASDRGDGRYLQVSLSTLDRDARPDDPGAKQPSATPLVFLMKHRIPGFLGSAGLDPAGTVVVEGPLPAAP